ncbi:MAG: bifunctional oligoribonuclease/PAP phosphatase NrnA [Deltaproteobacteria bacterium]|jgi:phosphoesterase RecJ-like protein|nr:bifunctional oligoribonuclease/PAP phosphatase NrnA [Deltaproteobacteria bacterium]
MTGSGPILGSLFLETLKKAGRVLVMGHSNPDGDSLGSCSALALALESRGQAVTLGYQGRIHSHLSFLAAGIKDCRPVSLSPGELADFDLMVMVDCLEADRIWENASDFSFLPPVLLIDHHPGRPEGWQPLAAYTSPLVSSSGELVFQVLEKLGTPLTRPIAEALLAALMSDTGFFSQNNVTSESFRQASILVQAGARPEYLTGCLKRNWTQSRVRLLALALGSVEMIFSGRVATMLLTQSMLEEAGAGLDDMDGFVEYPRSMSGAEAAALFRIDGQGRTRVSLRSGLTLSVRELAEHFGGGGHQQAAAYTDPLPDPQAARERFKALAGRYLKLPGAE